MDAQYMVVSRAPREVMWEFCMDPDNWVHLIPGYCSHEVFDDRRSALKVQVDLGPFSKLVAADVTILELIDHERVKLSLNGSDSTPFSGEAEFRSAHDAEGTRLSFDVNLTPSGPMGPMVNAVGGPVLQRMTEVFGSELVRTIEMGAGLPPRSAPTEDKPRPSRQGWASARIATVLAALRSAWRHLLARRPRRAGG